MAHSSESHYDQRNVLIAGMVALGAAVAAWSMFNQNDLSEPYTLGGSDEFSESPSEKEGGDCQNSMGHWMLGLPRYNFADSCWEIYHHCLFCPFSYTTTPQIV
ncbi:MAG: hypothetical protein AAB439_00190 [Patescibacteria group bacterium]